MSDLISEGSEESLRDGRRILLRPLRPADGDRLERFWRRLEPEAQRRLLEIARVSEGRVAAIASGRAGTEGGVVATTRADGERLLGVARYQRGRAGSAQFLVFVDLEVRGLGIGTALLRALAVMARRAGIQTITGDIRRGETPMLRLLEDAGLRFRRRDEGETVRAAFDVRETDRFLDSILRDRTEAARAALDRFLRPGSIAVVGASTDRSTIGGLLFANLLGSGFPGALLPVNRRHETVQGVVAYPDLASCPLVPDLAIVCVPAEAVAGIVAAAGDLGTRAVCVISAGFAEAGEAGSELQEHLVQIAEARGVRVVGPNCMGVLNGAADLRFNGTFSRAFPSPGRVSLLTQSGAVGLAALEQAEARGIGIGGFVSIGNSADVGGNDLLLYWGQDEGTDVILLYLESIQDPRWFARIARRTSRSRPIVAVKSGRTAAGRRAAASHTAALATGEVAVDALFRQAGVIRTETMEEMFEVAALLTGQPPPPGRRVAILTNGGGPGILAADACEANGLLVPELSEDTAGKLRAFLPAEASVRNPIDMIASATAEQYGKAVSVLQAAPEVDALIVMFIPPILTRAEEVASELLAARSGHGRPTALVTVFMNREGAPAALGAAGIPSFRFPENAARALARVARWGEWCQRPAGNVMRPNVDPSRVRELVASTLPGEGDAWIPVVQAESLLASYGIPVARSTKVRTPEEAASAQRELACPVAVKLAAPVHKTDVGGVRLRIDTPRAAADALREMRSELEAAGLAHLAREFVVQELVESGREMIVGVNHDPLFGPLVAVGLGGELVEVLGDVSVRITPLTDTDIEDMLRSLRSYRLLTGFRGAPALDVPALRDLLHRVSALVEDVPEIAEMDLNPVFVREEGVLVTDVRVRMAAVPTL